MGLAVIIACKCNYFPRNRQKKYRPATVGYRFLCGEIAKGGNKDCDAFFAKNEGVSKGFQTKLLIRAIDYIFNFCLGKNYD